jgi:hypothetical protein
MSGKQFHLETYSLPNARGVSRIDRQGLPSRGYPTQRMSDVQKLRIRFVVFLLQQIGSSERGKVKYLPQKDNCNRIRT